MYKVLWFDDDFSKEDIYDEIAKLRRESFLQDVEQASDFGIDYDSACTIEEFEDKMQKNENLYQAVILDLMGLNPNDSSDDSGIYTANNVLNQAKGIIKYVYSNNIDKPKFKDFLKACFQKENIFSKAIDCTLLFEKINSDLNDALDCYQGHIECLHLFNMHYLSGNNRSKMDMVMRGYKEMKDSSSIIADTIKNCIRTLFEDMLLKFASIYPGMSNLKTPNDRLNYIVRDCQEISPKKYDYTKPLVPVSDCPQEVKNCMDFCWNMTNNYSHNNPVVLNCLPHGTLYGDYFGPYLNEAIYNSFFVTMKWYYGYMTNHFK